jgi:hypothetical protein
MTNFNVPHNFIDRTGEVIGRWTVLRRADTKAVHTVWVCQCRCGKLRNKFWCNVVANGGKAGCGCGRRRLLRPYEAIYKQLVREAKHGGRTNTLTYEQFLRYIGQRCHYCNESLVWQEFGTHNHRGGYNIDRKDNAQGYSAANCVACCPRCNRAKSDHFTYTEWVQIGRLVRDMRTA